MIENSIDAFFSSAWFFSIPIIIGLGAIAPIWISGMSRTMKMILTVICAILMIFPVFPGLLLKDLYGWGYSRVVSDVWSDDSYIYGIDRSSLGGGRSRTGSYHVRLNALNRKTGERVWRQSIGKPHVFQRSYVLYDVIESASTRRRSFGVIDLHSGKIREYDSESLATSVSKLSEGVSEWDFFQETGWIKIVTKKGQTYYLEPLGLEVQAQPPPLPIDMSPKVGKYIQVSDKRRWLLKGEQVKQIYTDERQVLGHNIERHKLSNTPLTDQKFLLGEFVFEDAVRQRVGILHYDDTDKTNFSVTCLDFSGKTLWTCDQHNLDATDFFSDNPKFGDAKLSNGDLVLSCGGFIISVDVETGKVNWKSRT